METFTDDLRYVSRRLNLSLAHYFQGHQFRYDYAKDAIEDSIHSPFWWLQAILRCMSKLELGLRVWRKLQIRGLIDSRLPFPYTEEEFLKVNASQFVQDSLQAYLKSTDSAQLKKQKRDALIEAYRSVNVNDLNKMRTVLSGDFAMFGYDSSPVEVFDRTSTVNGSTGAFDWSRPWVG